MAQQKFEQAGMASVSTVVVLIILIVAVGTLITSLSLSDSLSISGWNTSNRALDFARSGAKDALQRIVRERDYSGIYALEMLPAGCASPYAGCVTVTVASGLSPKIISTQGRLGNLKRNIQVAVSLDADGLITDYNWQEE